MKVSFQISAFRIVYKTRKVTGIQLTNTTQPFLFEKNWPTPTTVSFLKKTKSRTEHELLYESADHIVGMCSSLDTCWYVQVQSLLDA